jgi:hypothetical protein
MQGISLYKRNADGSTKLMYHTFHKRNGDYLEKEASAHIFSVLSQVDSCDPSSFHTEDSLNMLINDLDTALSEAKSNNDQEMCNHIKEIIVLSKLCLWNSGELILLMSPFEHISPDSYPSALPEKYKFNIANAGIAPGE